MARTDWNGAAQELHERVLNAAEGNPALIDIADLHKPVAAVEMPVCRGCDRDNLKTSDDPLWPCRTATKLVRHVLGVDDVEAYLGEIRGRRPVLNS